MFLPFAQWLMQGRSRAITVVAIALLTSPVIWPNGLLAAAAASLITLRSGARNGLMLWLTCLAPAILLAVYVDSQMPFLLLTVSLASAGVLRWSRRWDATLLAMMLASLLASVALVQLAEPSLQLYVQAMEEFLARLQQQLAEQQPAMQDALPAMVSSEFIAGMFGLMLVTGSSLSLVLARSWQAGLYNPGGFRAEFHRLRLGPASVLLMLLLAGLLFMGGVQYLPWAWIVLFPLLIAGVALFHAIGWQRKWRTHWYVIFYIMLVMWDPLKMIMVGMAMADSLIDFRRRLSERNTDQDT